AALRKPLGAAHVIAKVDRIRARGPRRVNEDATAAGRRLDAVDRQLKRRANRYAGAARHVERASGGAGHRARAQHGPRDIVHKDVVTDIRTAPKHPDLSTLE